MDEDAPKNGGPVFRVSTDMVAPRERFDFWWESFQQAALPLTTSEPQGAFEGSLTGRILGEVALLDLDVSNVVVKRTRADIARRLIDCVAVFQQLGADGSDFRTLGRESGHVGPGDLVVGDADEVWESRTRSRFRHRVWLVPRRLILPYTTAPDTLARGFYLSRGQGTTAMLGSYLAELGRQADQLDPRSAASFAETLGRLIAIAADSGEAHEHSVDALASGQLAVVRREIRMRLTDPLLSPSRIARACGISVRKLHALFEPTGVSFSEYVLAQRLAAVHAVLVNDERDPRPVSEIAFAFGFNSLSTFYRAYRRTYGDPPGRTRAR